MTAAWVLERVRTTQAAGHAWSDTDSARDLRVSTAPSHPPAKAEHLKNRFTERHFQSNSRFQLPQHRQQQVGIDATYSQLAPCEVASSLNKYSDAYQLRPEHRALAARLAAAAVRQQQRRQQQQQQHCMSHAVWSRKVGTDIQMICKELDLPSGVATALSESAAKGHISCNPGVLLSQLVRLLPLEPLLSDLLGQRNSLAALLAAHPTLLRSDPQSLQANCTHLQEFLGREPAAAAVARCPQVLGCSPFRISANLTMLQSLLGYSSTHAAAAVIVRQPMLLLCSPDSLQLRWEQLQQLFAAVPSEKLSKQLRKTPELLLMRASTLAAKLKCLEVMFIHSDPDSTASRASCGRDQAVGPASTQHPAAALQQQKLLTTPQQQQQQHVLNVYKAHQLSYRLQRLQQLVQKYGTQQTHFSSNYGYGVLRSASADISLHHQPQQQLIRQQQQGISQHANGFEAPAAADASASPPAAGSLHVAARVQNLAVKVPALLSLSPATLHHHLIQLQLLLGLQADDVRLARAVLLQPGLLTQAPSTLANKVQLLQELTGQTEAYVQEMSLRCPAVLTLSSTSITRKWELLQSCTAACALWQRQLAAAPAVTVAMMLCYSMQRLQRLQYVVQIAQPQRHQGVRTDSPERPSAPQAFRPVGPAGTTAEVDTVAAVAALKQGGGMSRCTARRRGMPVSSGARVHMAGSGVKQQQQQLQILDLASVPWKSVIQESEDAFCSRFPGYEAWKQQ